MNYRFGPCDLDVANHVLTVDGQVRQVEPQVFDLLHHLVKNPERMVSREELIDAVWGGRIVSDSAISARINAARQAVDDDGTRQAVIKTVPRRGFRFVATLQATGNTAGDKPSAAPTSQRVRFCTSRDGTQIAYATTGTGQPLVRAGHWLTHLEHDWHSPVWRPFLDKLGQRFAVTRYDQRGNGLSDWNLKNHALENFVDDFGAVVDAAGLDRFAIYGTSQGAPIAIAYAARHPERVSHLVLHGGYVRGRMLRAAADEREQAQALLTLMRLGWGKQGSPFIKAFTTMYIPDGTAEQTQSLAELQRLTTSPENAVKLRNAVDHFDATDYLAKVLCPTLVLHARNDGVHPLDQGRKLAAGITNAEFVMLESANHAILPQEPAWQTLFEAIGGFLLADQ
ncbi:MAG: alpha/beta fold hydrolase [Alphaproteobacteria bacterium]